jgi:hypothetical protein
LCIVSFEPQAALAGIVKSKLLIQAALLLHLSLRLSVRRLRSLFDVKFKNQSLRKFPVKIHLF